MLNDSFNIPCTASAVTDTTTKKTYVVPTIQDNAVAVANTGLWKLPDHVPNFNYTRFLKEDSTNEFTIKPNQPVNLCHAGDIYLYGNFIKCLYHLGNYLSPLVAEIPALTYDENKNKKPSTLVIEHPIFHPLLTNFSLDEASFAVQNNYGDNINPGILQLQFIVRKKTD